MKIEINQNPISNAESFDYGKNSQGRKSSSKLGLIVFAAAALVTVLNILASVVLYNIFLRQAYPYPIVQNNYQIDYNFEDDYWVAVADQNAQHVVEVIVSLPSIGAPNLSYGSGVIIDYDGRKPYILTNAHVITPNGVACSPDDIQIRMYGSIYDSPVGSVSIIGKDLFNDIAVLKLNYEMPLSAVDNRVKLPDYCVVNEAGSFSGVRYAFEDGGGLGDIPLLGARVMAIGNALGRGISACDGIISLPLSKASYSKDSPAVTLMQITAPINPGNSGGGLFNLKGQLIGINSARHESSDNISFSIPIELALTSAYNLMRDFMGVTVQYSATNAMTFVNLGLGLDYEAVLTGAQETSHLFLNLTGTGTLPYFNEVLTSGRRVTAFAGVSFSGDIFDGLQLAQKRLLLLKAECNLYNYRVKNDGDPLVIELEGVEYYSYNVTR